MFYFRSNISIFGALSLLFTDVTCKRPVVFEHPVPNATSSVVQNARAREFRSGEGNRTWEDDKIKHLIESYEERHCLWYTYNIFMIFLYPRDLLIKIAIFNWCKDSFSTDFLVPIFSRICVASNYVLILS